MPFDYRMRRNHEAHNAARAATQAHLDATLQGANPATATPTMSATGVGNIATSITPQQVFSPQQTHWATNQARADNSARAGMRSLLHQQDRPGVSRSASSVMAVLPKIADARGQSAYAQQAIPFQDAQANAQAMLQGQQARGQEWLGLAGAANRMNQNQQQHTNSQMQQFFDLMRLLGF